MGAQIYDEDDNKKPVTKTPDAKPLEAPVSEVVDPTTVTNPSNTAAQ